MDEEILSKLNIDQTLQAKNWTFLGVGGAPIFTFSPKSIDEIKFFLQYKSKEIQYRTLGAGANILVRDKGYGGIFIRMHKGFKNISIQNNLLITESGVNFVQLTNFCIQHNIGGLEFLATIPGQVGGWIKMNAGTPQKEIKDVLEWIEYIDHTGSKNKISNAECEFSYRKSKIKNDWIITKAAFKIYTKPNIEIKKEIIIAKNKRKETQPTIGKLAGCFFKNPPQIPAWKIIENTKILGNGNTSISTKHKNFIIADIAQNAYEIEYLIESIRSNALFNQKTFLESEVERIGIL